MDLQSRKRRDLLAVLLSMSAAACSAPQDDTADAAPDPPNVVAAAPPTAAAQTQCEWESGFRISRDSIGPLATTDPVGVVKELCSQMRDTLWSSADRPGIVMPIPGGELFGKQSFFEVLDEEQRVTLWEVTGDGLLPEGISMKSTWGDLRRAYGPGSGSHEAPPKGTPDYVTVLFDRYDTGFVFFLRNLDTSELEYPSRFELDIDLSTVPDSATIAKVYVRPPGVPER